MCLIRGWPRTADLPELTPADELLRARNSEHLSGIQAQRIIIESLEGLYRSLARTRTSALSKLVLLNLCL